MDENSDVGVGGSEREPSNNHRTRIELLTEQFYAWERRGRGWLVWDYPVELEPPFLPFRLHEVTRPSLLRDDARRPTLLSSLADGVKQLIRLRGRPAREDGFMDDSVEEVEPDGDGPTSMPAVYCLSAPPTLNVSREVAEQFLVGAPAGAGPLSFEIIGTAQVITAQIACRAEDERDVRGRFLAHFPDVVAVKNEDTLQVAWEQTEGAPVIVDFGLASEFMLPLRTVARFDPDPLTGLVAALADLEEGEVGILQVLFEPVRHPWTGSIERAVLDGEGRSFFLDAPDLPRLARAKIARPLFACVLRVAARAAEEERSWQIVRALGGALKVLTHPPGNELVPLENEGYDKEDHELDLILRMSHRSGMLLSAEELASLVHPPGASVRTPKLKREVRKTKAAPPIAAGHPLVLGVNVHAGQRADVTLDATQRIQHLYAIGASGTGKSTFLLNLIVQDLKKGEGIAVLDPHGDLIDEILSHVPEERLDDVVLVDPSDSAYPVGFNILSAHTELEETLLSSDLVAVFRRLSTSWGDQMNSVLANAILAFLESERGGTLVDLRRFLVERKFREEYLATVHDSECVYYWEKEFTLLKGHPQAPILTRLDTFLRPKIIRHMVAQKENRLDFASIMNEGKIFLAKLAQGAIGEENAYLLGTLLVAKLQQTAMSRQELAQAERRPFYLYIDEFHNFVTPSMAQILSGARKYRLGLILAHQDIGQLQSRSPDLLDAVLTNPYTRVCFRVGDQDARALEGGFASFDRKDLQNLGIGQAIVRIERAEYDCNLDTPPAPTVDPVRAKNRRERAVTASRAKYARPRQEVENLLRAFVPVTPPERDVSESVETPPERRREKRAAPPPTTRVQPKATVARQPVPPTISVPAAGRGGSQHRYLQELIKRWAEAHGWRAAIEEGILDEMGSVDVALRKGERSVACEIAVTTEPAHELGNIQKCLASGFERVILVSAQKRTLATVRDLVRENLSEDELSRVDFGTPEDVFALLEARDAEAATTEGTVKGYKVKVRYKSVEEGEKKVRRQAVSQVIAKALGRLKSRD